MLACFEAQPGATSTRKQAAERTGVAWDVAHQALFSEHSFPAPTHSAYRCLSFVASSWYFYAMRRRTGTGQGGGRGAGVGAGEWGAVGEVVC